MRIVFLHGLEGSPTGIKPRTLQTFAEVHAPALPVQPLMAWRERVVTGGTLPPYEVLEPSLSVARLAVAVQNPDVVVGSSFGAGLATRLAIDGVWTGPLLLLAPAAERLFGAVALPPRPGAVLIVHARGDDVVPFAHSVALVQASSCPMALWAVDDDHRLTRFVEEGGLQRAVSVLMRLAGQL